MTDRKTTSTITDTELDQLYDELAALRTVARGYCPACGRGDAAPTVEDWEQQRQRADHLTTELTALRDDLNGITGARWIADMLDTILHQPAPAPSVAAPRTTDDWTQQDDGTWTLPIYNGGGVLTVPASITADERARLAAAWPTEEQPHA